MHRNVCYNNCRQKDISFPRKQNERPEDGTFGALFIGCAVYTLPVQPLANVVGNYTCSNRQEKGYKQLQESHLLPAGKSQQHNQYITFVEMCRYILTLIYKPEHPEEANLRGVCYFLNFYITLLGCISRICCSDFFLIGVNVENTEILFPF